jgi:hypothetical protein
VSCGDVITGDAVMSADLVTMVDYNSVHFLPT